MKAKEFDELFDAGQDVTGNLDLAAARRPLRSARRVNVDFPSWMSNRSIGKLSVSV